MAGPSYVDWEKVSDTIIDKLNECLKETDPEDDVIFVPRWYVDEAIERIAALEKEFSQCYEELTAHKKKLARRIKRRKMEKQRRRER